MPEVTVEKLNVEAEADTANAERELTGFQFKTEALVQALDSLSADIKVNADASGLRGEVTRAAKVAGTGQSIKIPVKAESTAAENSLRQIQGLLKGTAISSFGLSAAMSLIKWPAYVTGANLLTASLGALVAMTGSLVGALGPVLGLLGAIPSLAVAGGTAIGLMVSAFGPIGKALKGYSQQEEQSTKAAASGAKSTASAARSREQAAKSVARAQQGLRDAEVAAAEGIANADRRVRDAKINLAEAQDRARAAQERLTDARKRAAMTLRDLTLQVQRNEIAERRAQLRLKGLRAKANADQTDYIVTAGKATDEMVDAQNRLKATQEGLVDTAAEQEQKALDLAEAEQDLISVTQQRSDDQERLNELQRKGIDGSEEVVAAQNDILDANKAVAKSNEDVQDSIKELAKTHEQGARSIADASAAIADAAAALSGLEDAAAAAADGGIKPFDDAMAKLTPAGRDLVTMLLSFKEPLKALREGFQNAMFPGLVDGLGRVRDVIGSYQPVVTETGRVLGNFFRDFLTFVSTPAFTKDFQEIMMSNTRVLGSVGNATVSLTSGLRYLMLAAMPLTEWLGKMTEQLAKLFEAKMKAGQESGRLAAFFEKTREITTLLFKALGNLMGIFMGIGRAGYNMGRDLISSFVNITARAKEWVNSAEGQKKITAYFDAFRPVLTAIAALMKDVGKAFVDLSMKNAPHLKDTIDTIRTKLLPVIVELLTRAAEHGPKFIELITSVARVFGDLLNHTGGFTVFLDLIKRLADITSWLIRNVPGMGMILSILGTIAGISMTAGFIAFMVRLAGIPKIISLIGKTSVGQSIVSKIATSLGMSSTGGAGLLAGIIDKFKMQLGRLKGAASSQQLQLFGAGGATKLSPATFARGLGLAAVAAYIAEQLISQWSQIWDKLSTGKFLDAAKKAAWFTFKNTVGLIPSWIVEHLGPEILSGLSGAWDAVAGWFTDLPGRLGGFFSDVGGWLIDFGSKLLGGLWEGIRIGAEFVWDWFRQLPGRIFNLLGNIGRWLVDKGMVLLHGLWSGIEEGAKAVWGFFSGMAGRIFSAIGDVAGWLVEHGKRLLKGFVNGIVEGAKEIWSWFERLPGFILSSIGDAGRWLMDVGKKIIDGLVNGIKGAGGAVLNAIKDLGGGLVGKALGVFGIGSPSKVFMTIGEQIGQGLALGIASQRGLVEKAIGTLTNVAHPSGTDLNSLGGLGGRPAWNLGAGLPGLPGGLSGQTRSITVGDLKIDVTVQGSAKPEDITEAIKLGGRDVLDELVNTVRSM